MIYDIYRIGKVVTKETNYNMDPLIVPETPTDITHVMSLCFENKDGDTIYKGIELTEYNREQASMYLLRKAGANGANFGPSAIKTEFAKTMDKKIVAWFKEAYSTYEEITEEVKILNDITESLQEHKEEIIDELSESEPKGKGIKILLMVKLNTQFPINVPIFYKSYEKKIRAKVVGEDMSFGTCCLCGRKEVKLLPEGNAFAFYTKDKPGFISGGFQEKDFWRNCPICVDCGPILRQGKKFMLENLKYKFYGMDYYIIPSSTCNDDIGYEITNLLENQENKKFSFQKTTEQNIKFLEEDVFYALAEYNDIHSFRILFFRKDNAAERIILDMKDIFPSRFRELYNGKDFIHKTFKDVMFHGESKQQFTFRFYRDFLSKTDKQMRNYDLDQIFLNLVQTIFTKSKISMHVLLPHYMRDIRRAFEHEEYFRNTVLKAWIGVRYLNEIGCLDYGGVKKMENKVSSVLEQYNAGLDTDIKKALVLTGALVQKVMNIQAKELNGSTPFSSRLKSLKLRQEDVQGVISECVNKMMEYESYSKESKQIVSIVTELIFTSPAKWELSTDEINFYIVGGMALMAKIYESFKEEKNDDTGKKE